MPDKTELITIELGPHCNLGKLHPKCPTTHPERHGGVDKSRLLTDDMIVDTAVGLYRDHGFTGYIAYHGFTEPTIYANRMLALSERIRAAWPASRFLLWSNATLLPEDCSRYAIFSQCHLTDYTADGKPPKNVDALRAVCHDVRIHPGVLDDRLTAIGNSYQPCVRMFCEWNVSAYGSLNLCCYAWRAKDAIGNLFDDPLPVLVKRWQTIRDLISGNKMQPGSPRCCIGCGMRTQSFTSFAPEIAERARLHVANLRAQPPAERSPGVIFVHYKLPPERLAAHWDWNDRLYRETGAKVFVTTDQEYPVPDYARCIVYTKPMPVFCLSATKNAAIQAALYDGCNPILSTDVDITIPRVTWDQFVRVRSGVGVVPFYKMVRTYEERNAEDAPVDPGATGVVGMTADGWQAIQYDERFVGYGAEDGQLRMDMRRVGVQENRSSYVWHVAHDPSASQINTPGHGRADAWNRDTINPNRFLENRKLHH